MKDEGFCASGLGPVATWPAALRRYVELAMASRDAMYVAWGPDLAFIYNDAYVPIFPDRHPTALGRPFGDVWSDIWPRFGIVVNRVLAGESMRFEEDHIPMLRGGRLQDAWFTYSLTPLRDDTGAAQGLLCVTREVTDAVLTRRREEAATAALQARTEALSIVNEAGAKITAELDIERAVQVAVDASVELTEAEFGAFFYNTVDAAGESYMLYALAGADRNAFSRFPHPRNTDIFAPTFRGEGIVRSNDITQDPRYGRNLPHSGMPVGHLPVRSYLAVPVRSRTGDVLGGILLGHPEAGRFDDASEASLVSLAGQAAVAIDNARLLQSAERELRHRRRAEEQLRQLNENLEARVAQEIAERQQAERALQQAQKMEVIGQLTGGVAHDFNNLLQVVSGNLQLLNKDVAGNARAERRIINALAGVERGAKLASQLLAFGRRQALEPKPVDLGRLLTGMDDLLRRSVGEAVSIETVLADGPCTIFADPVQVENAVLNLAINARDAMEGSGRLTISVAVATLDEPARRLHPEMALGPYVSLAITDTGCGMDAEVMSHVFEPFYTTKAEGKGTGLGLSMVYGFVRQSGGHVAIDSAIGRGTTVTLFLPRSECAEDVAGTDHQPDAVHGAETILAVEDDPEVRLTVVEMLKDLGYDVLAADSAESALAVIDGGAAIDLLFTDVVMPGDLRSTELAERARAALPGLAVLFTSGYAEDVIVHDGRLDAGVELLSKPYTEAALATKLRQVLARAASANAAAAEPPSILLVEDEAIIRMSTTELLQDAGHRVTACASAEEARGELARGPFDILVTDVSLPGESGLELAVEARRLRPELGVIFATGKDSVPALDGGTVLLRKPYDAAQLAEAIRRLGPAAAAASRPSP
ncbi:response regulator [Aurantimonas sp. CSK15Z-1]|nr:response regulator [Aurantimonas sp. CSK15Z-1]MCQ8783406.1 response regulator [Aurantimonas sp. CSK15Z-1]